MNMNDLSPVWAEMAAWLMPNAMANDSGDLFYPDDHSEARWFADEHGAVPMYPSVFPFTTDEMTYHD